MNNDNYNKIDKMSQYEMARLWRFAPSDHPYMQGDLGDYFKKSFDSKGGMTSTISKQIGWK